MGVPEGPFYPLATRSGIRASLSPARERLYLGGSSHTHGQTANQLLSLMPFPAGKVTRTMGGFTALPAPPRGALLHGVHVFWIRV